MDVSNVLSKMTFIETYFLSNYYSGMRRKLKHLRIHKTSKLSHIIVLGKSDSRPQSGKIKGIPRKNTLNKRNGNAKKAVIYYNYV